MMRGGRVVRINSRQGGGVVLGLRQGCIVTIALLALGTIVSHGIGIDQELGQGIGQGPGLRVVLGLRIGIEPYHCIIRIRYHSIPRYSFKPIICQQPIYITFVIQLPLTFRSSWIEGRRGI